LKRDYDNTLRRKQAEETRDRILEAMIDQLGRGVHEFSIQQVAADAGVSIRTIYLHFPNRDSQIEAVAARLDAKLTGSEQGPKDLEDVPIVVERTLRQGSRHMRELRAQVTSGLATEVRKRRRRARDRAVEAAVATNCDPSNARLAAAAINVINSAEVGLGLVDRYGLDIDEAAKTIVWVIRIIIDAIKRKDLPAPPVKCCSSG